MLTFDEIKEKIRERENPDSIIDMLDISIDELIDSGCLDEKIYLKFDELQDIYKDGGFIGK